ncbi:MAG: FAD-binding protein [Chloroflexi bacterium AL-W]|nr:FAD-binding protein [Chloroflexi bacterium AL-N1]NOK64639.1 FAD-binding protein [Chloroflexi bacterium AL-N10]NOK75880.1 FAD-binding protein [Chloroflexi bacterium AL-N5]NOK80362.1 FAD-binding protein [Chloroflexi bacterium AL-W]NOK86875.1 FAD-binding protein [Chloroflexi bacterium AL-N15]
MRAIIAGAGPAGFACAKWLTDRGYEVVLLEKRDVPGGKVSAWRDEDGDWVESGLHVFFGAYRNLLSFLDECELQDCFDWKPSEMVFASPEHGQTSIRFVPWLPPPINGLAGVATTKLIGLPDKARMALGLTRPIFGNQAYIDAQDEQTYAAWHLRHGMGEHSLRGVMDTMALALNFQDTNNVSAKLPLTAMLHFAQQPGAAKMGAIKGSPHERLWVPLIDKLEARGVQVLLNHKVTEILYDEMNNRITGFLLDDGSTITGDIYISAMPVHSLRKTIPAALKAQPYFDNLKHLKGQPVITAQLYFDRMVTHVDNLIFSAHSHISVYADLPRISPDYTKYPGSVIELVVAPAEKLINQDDETVLEQILGDFYRLHPEAREAKLTKYTLVRIPNSVYQARPGVDKYRPDQASPVPNFFLTGDYTQQEFMASIEGAIRSAKRTIERIDRVGVEVQEIAAEV